MASEMLISDLELEEELNALQENPAMEATVAEIPAPKATEKYGELPALEATESEDTPAPKATEDHGDLPALEATESEVIPAKEATACTPAPGATANHAVDMPRLEEVTKGDQGRKKEEEVMPGSSRKNSFARAHPSKAVGTKPRRFGVTPKKRGPASEEAVLSAAKIERLKEQVIIRQLKENPEMRERILVALGALPTPPPTSDSSRESSRPPSSDWTLDLELSDDSEEETPPSSTPPTPTGEKEMEVEAIPPPAIPAVTPELPKTPEPVAGPSKMAETTAPPSIKEKARDPAKSAFKRLADKREEGLSNPPQNHHARGSRERSEHSREEARARKIARESLYEERAPLCYNCRQPGHKYSRCPEPASEQAFCYLCGRAGETAATCPACAEKWRKRGAYVAGFGRSLPREDIRALKAAREKLYALEESRLRREIQEREDRLRRHQRAHQHRQVTPPETPYSDISDGEIPELNPEEINRDIATAHRQGPRRRKIRRRPRYRDDRNGGR